MIDATEKTTAIRVATLTRISGLTVECYMQSGTRYFVFGPLNQPIKTVCTYRKARTFAEGVAVGRIRTKMTPPLPNALFLAGSFAIFGLAVASLLMPQLATAAVLAALLIVVAGMSFGYLKY